MESDAAEDFRLEAEQIARALRRDAILEGLPESGERILNAEQIKVLIAFREAVK